MRVAKVNVDKIYQVVVLRRIKKIFKDKSLATYQLQKRSLVERLNGYFWDRSNGLDGYWNKRIYRNQIRVFISVIENKSHTIDSVRKNLADILNKRTEEIITQLIDQDILRADDNKPPSYRVVTASTFRFIVVFRWMIINVLFLGLLIGITSNLISNYIWKLLGN